MTALEFEGIGKRFGRNWALRDVDFGIGPGERLALLGHNGAGKTTLMKLALGLITPDLGRVRRFGRPPAGGESVGFLPENTAFTDAMTGRQLLGFYARLKRRGPAECDRLLERVGLDEAADRRIGTYSKGMRQRLGLAQALLGEPRLLLLDEPTNGLDPALRAEFYGILGQLAAAGTAILLASHHLAEMEGWAGRVIILDHGRMAASGSIQELRARSGLVSEISLKPQAGRLSFLAEALAGFAPRPDDLGGLTIDWPADKTALFAAASKHASDIDDIELKRPGLDALYAHFTSPAGRKVE